LGLRLLVDEDTQSRRLVDSLRHAGHDILTASEAGLCGQPDAQALARATQDGRLLLTQNCDDFRALHSQGTAHAGIITVYHDSDPSKNMTHRAIVSAIANLEASGIDLSGEFVALNAWQF